MREETGGGGCARSFLTLRPFLLSLFRHYQAAGAGAKAAVGAVAAVAGTLHDAYERFAPVVKDVGDALAPAVTGVAKLVGAAAGPLLKAATPVLKASGAAAEDFLASQGLNTRVLVDGAKSAGAAADAAINGAVPAAEKAAAAAAAAGPVAVAQAAAGLGLLYVVGPPLVRSLSTAARGYAGDVSPAAALDAVSAGGDVALVDIRSAREKESAGLPDLPSGGLGGGGGRYLEVEFAGLEDRRLRGALRDAAAVERRVTALQVASLKRLGKGTRILLMDRNGGGAAKAIARELRSLGFKRVFVVVGGFSGWAGSKLKTRMATTVSSARVEVLPALPIFGGSQSARLPAPRRGSQRLVTGGKRGGGGGSQRLLPPPGGR